MAVIDWWNGPPTLVVIFFALCLLLLTWSIAGVACRACHSSGTFFHCDTHTHAKRPPPPPPHTHTHTHTHTLTHALTHPPPPSHTHTAHVLTSESQHWYHSALSSDLAKWPRTAHAYYAPSSSVPGSCGWSKCSRYWLSLLSVHRGEETKLGEGTYSIKQSQFGFHNENKVKNKTKQSNFQKAKFDLSDLHLDWG